MTRSGSVARVCPASAVQESARITRGRVAISGATSAQYFVHAITRSSSPIAARMTVALGCRLAMRRGVWEKVTNFTLSPDAAQRQRKRVQSQLCSMSRGLGQTSGGGDHVLPPQVLSFV